MPKRKDKKVKIIEKKPVNQDKDYSSDEIEKERWSKLEIDKAAKILIEAEKKKSSLIRMLDDIALWMIMLVVILGNLLISAFLILISKLVSPFIFYIIILMIGGIFGLLIDIPVREIEKIDKKKQVLSKVLLPTLIVVNFLVLIGLKILIELNLKISFDFNIALAGILYGIAFLLPHFTLHKKRGQKIKMG
jgi:hypothetical protein